MPLYAKEQTDWQQSPEAWSGAWHRFSFTALRRNQPRGHLGLELPASELWDKELLGFKPPSWRCFVMAVLTKWCTWPRRRLELQCYAEAPERVHVATEKVSLLSARRKTVQEQSRQDKHRRIPECSPGLLLAPSWGFRFHCAFINSHYSAWASSRGSLVLPIPPILSMYKS